MAKTELTTAEQEGFDKCWAVYRKKAGKGQAMVTWGKQKFTDAQVRKIFDAIIAQNRAGDEYCEKRFLRHFSTWLNDLGWEDEIPSAVEAYKPDRRKNLTEGYDERYLEMADKYCESNGLHKRGVTPRRQAMQNMANFMAEKLGKRVFKRMFPTLAELVK